MFIIGLFQLTCIMWHHQTMSVTRMPCAMYPQLPTMYAPPSL